MLLRPISDMKLKRKLLVSYFLLIIIPFGIFTYFSESRVSKALETKVKFSTMQSFDQSADFITYKIQKIMDALSFILLDKKLNATLAQNPKSTNIHTQIRDMFDLTDYLKSLENNDEIFNIKLYVNGAFMYSRENVNFLNLQTAKKTSWYKDLISSGSNVLWLPIPANEFSPYAAEGSMEYGQKKVSAIRPILDSNNYLNIIGILRIDILESNLNDILKKASSTSKSITYILNSKDQIISGSSENIAKEFMINNHFLNTKIHSDYYFNPIKLNNKEVLLATKTIPHTDWTMVSITPYSEILSDSNNIRKQMLILFILIGTAAYGIAYIISFSITKRIRLLINKMRNIKNGKFSNEITSNSKDEIGELLINFNEMNERLSFLVKDQFRLGQEAKNFELIALQAQINPHFLYNTLDLINWTAINNNVPDISNTVKALSKFYKLTLSKGSNIIPIRDEIEHIKLYIDIQNMRYDNNILFITDINEEIYLHTTIKIILQPIVENSIIHGILQKTDKKGIIKVTGSIENNSIIFTVEDDGIGIPQDKVTTLLSTLPSKASHGYGIRNINERIQLFYGDSYGLSYESTLGKGTIVTVKIPLDKKTV